jgi:hypothetical protein
MPHDRLTGGCAQATREVGLEIIDRLNADSEAQQPGVDARALACHLVDVAMRGTDGVVDSRSDAAEARDEPYVREPLKHAVDRPAVAVDLKGQHRTATWNPEDPSRDRMVGMIAAPWVMDGQNLRPLGQPLGQLRGVLACLAHANAHSLRPANGQPGLERTNEPASEQGVGTDWVDKLGPTRDQAGECVVMADDELRQ